MGVAKKGRGNNFQNCSTGSKVLYGCQLVISGEKSFLARSATIIPFGSLLYAHDGLDAILWLRSGKTSSLGYVQDFMTVMIL